MGNVAYKATVLSDLLAVLLSSPTPLIPPTSLPFLPLALPPPKPFVRPSSTASVPTAGTVPPSSSTQNTIPDLETHTTCPAPTPLPISFTTQLLAAYSSSIFPLPDQNPRSDQKLRSSSTDTNSAPQISSSFPNFGILPAPITPPLASVPPIAPLPHPSPSNTPPIPQSSTSQASKAKANTDRTLKRLSPQTFSPEGVPRVIIPDEVYRRGAELHRDFVVCRFFGRVPAYSLIQNVLNYMWGKGKHLEIHMVPTKNSVLLRIPNDFIREKVLLKRLWYVDTAMFHVSTRSEFPDGFTPSLNKIQLWAHLKGVPFDLIYTEGLSHIAGQIGDPKETDDWTLSLTSISVAHVKVEIDTTIPLPKIVEVGRSDGTFVNVEIEYPWVPPICAHCKEIGHIQRNCLLLPPPAPPSTKEPPAHTKNPSSAGLPVCYSCKTAGHLMKNCPKGPRGPNDWIPVNHRKKPRENTPTQTPNSENTPPSAPSPPPPDLTTTTTNLSPPSSAHTPPKDPLPIQFSPTKAPSMIMEIDTDPLPSDNDEIIIIDDTGPYVLGLAAQKNSWQANQLILQREHVYKLDQKKYWKWRNYLLGPVIGHRRRLSSYPRDEPSSRTGIPSTATLAELWEIDHWVLPPQGPITKLEYTRFALTPHHGKRCLCPCLVAHKNTILH
ncbi:hypothetical protein Bca4012_029596 [Brassica carinata]